MVGGQEFLPIKYNQLISNHRNTRDRSEFLQILVLKLSSIISGTNKQTIKWKQDSIRKNQLSCQPRGFRPNRQTASPTEWAQPKVEVEAPCGVLE